ncbi:hypothetical protein R1N_48010 (plasmid) [Enterobacter asburiae]|nr:hypothetical protein R1N_48010 [Enterobacter asburiae]
MSVTIQGNTSTVISNNSAPEGTSEIAKITRQIQVLTEKLGKISSEEGMTTQQKKKKWLHWYRSKLKASGLNWSSC